MSFVRHSSQRPSFAERVARAPQQIDLPPGEWEEVGGQPVDEGGAFCTIASFWILAGLLLALIVAAPALHAAAHHLT